MRWPSIKIPNVPTDVMHIALSLLQKWSILIREADRERLGRVKEAILHWMKLLKPTSVMLSNIVEI